VLAIFNLSATPNVTVAYINGVLPYAEGNPNQGGLVALTDLSGTAIGTTDPRASDPRVAAAGSVYTSSIAKLIQTGVIASSYPAWLPGLAAPGAKVVDNNGNLQVAVSTQVGPALISPYLPADIPATLVTDLIAVTAGPTYTLGGWNTNIGGQTWQAISNNPPSSSVEWVWVNAGPASLPAYNPTAFVTFSLTSVTVVSGVVTYTGAITGTIGSESVSGLGNFFAGYRFTVAGFTNAGNNGTGLLCTASTATTLVLTNPYAVNEINPGTATLYEGGVSSDDIIYSTKNELLTSYLDGLAAIAATGVTSVFGRTGAVVAVAGDYTASQVGAAPASHVGQQLGLGTSHPASVTSDTGGFIVQEATASPTGDAYTLTSNASVRKAAISHSGDVFSLLANAANAQGGNGTGGTAVYTGVLGLMSMIANVLAEHVTYKTHGNNNPHNLDAADIGAVTASYVDTQISNIIADVTAYTDAKTAISVRVVTTPGPTFPQMYAHGPSGNQVGTFHAPNNSNLATDIQYSFTSATITYVIVNFGGFFEIAFGNGQYATGQQVALPEATGWTSSNFYCTGAPDWLLAIAYDTKGLCMKCYIPNATRIVQMYAGSDDSTGYVFNGIAGVTAIAWRNLIPGPILISAYDTVAGTFNAGHVGDTVIVTGRNFGATQGSTTVNFNGTAATVFPTWSSTSFSVQVPVGATTGPIIVTVPAVTPGVSPFVFTVS
jgi:hypothetical protein